MSSDFSALTSGLGALGSADEWWCTIFHTPSTLRHMYEKRASTGARLLSGPVMKVYMPVWRYASLP
jgi:hypothetical protein